MAGKIQTVPRGFLAALGLKTLGESPSRLPDTNQAVVETLPFYLVDAMQVVTAVENGVVASGVLNTARATVTIPANEIWVVFNVAAQATLVLGAPGRISIHPLTAEPGGTFSRLGQSIPNDTAANLGANASIINAFAPPYPWVFPPSWTFSTSPVDASAGDTFDFTTGVLRARFPA